MTETEQVDLLLDVVREVKQTRLVRSGALSDAFHFGGTAGFPPILSVSQPDDDDFRSFLLAIRKFTLKSDPTNINQVANIVLRRLSPGELRDFLIDRRNDWRAISERSGPMKVIIDGRRYDPADAFDLFINSGPFHHDPEKAKKFSSTGPHGQRLIRQQVNFFAVALVNYAQALWWTIQKGRQEGLLSV